MFKPPRVEAISQIIREPMKFCKHFYTLSLAKPVIPVVIGLKGSVGYDSINV